jgi:hypothetical protein
VVYITLKDRKFPLFLLLRSTAALLAICSDKPATLQIKGYLSIIPSMRGVKEKLE